jgi:hypothetical protein
MPRKILAALCLASLVACNKPPASTEPTAATPTTTEPTATDAPPQLPEAEQVLEEAVVALGGRDNIDALKSFYSEAKMEIASQNLTGSIKTWWKEGNFYMENDITGVGTTKVWKNGEEIWAEDPINGRRRLEGKEAAQTQWSTSVSLAADWKRFFSSAETIGVRSEGAQELIDIKLQDESGSEITLSFDAQTHLPAQQAFSQETPMGKLPVVTSMEDYREVAGIKTSFKSTTNMSVVTAVQVVEKFEPNVEIDDAKFTPADPKKPAKGAAKKG